jgi:chitobiase/beta-hexosaminidase-like protein
MLPPRASHSTRFLILGAFFLFVANGIQAQVATPTFNPNGGSFLTEQSVTISCATSGATIYYTIRSVITRLVHDLAKILKTMGFGGTKEFLMIVFGGLEGGSRRNSSAVESPSHLEFWDRVARIVSRFRSRNPKRLKNPFVFVGVVSRAFWSAARIPSRKEPPEWL